MQIVVGVIMIVCAFAAAMARRRFAAVLLVGAVGYGMAALFVIQGAPDLAITQLLIETLGIAVFVLAFRHLPADFVRPKLLGSQGVRIAVAVLAGLFVFGFTLVAIGARTEPSISGEYLDKAYSQGGGNNVVNVIVVDFRGFDTMGEIVVLAVAALGVAAIVRAKKTPAESKVEPSRTEMKS
jgi:multicomponent Na+:H+ antiporter subunit A